MSVYTKSKTSVSNLKTVELDTENKDSFKVGVAEGAEDLVIDYITNLYANPETAVVRELFTNASDASDKGDPIKIKFEQTNKDETDKNPGVAGVYKFTILDNGCGMSKEELKQHYITYASSNKVTDYEAVGSFGLGAKSPMALVPSYMATSNNGKEENSYKVARTKHGIYAVPTTPEEMSDHSFTKVEVDGLNRNQAEKMAEYVNNFIVPFSQHAVEVDNGCLNYTPTKFEKVELPLLESFTTTLYSKKPKKDLFVAFRGMVPKSAWLVRINDIVYPLFKQEYTSSFNVVIDIEPGYFAFAPSREELPSGEKLDHIKEIINQQCPFEKEVKFIENSGLFTTDEIADIYKREAFANFDTVRSAISIFGDKMYSIRHALDAILFNKPIAWDNNVVIRRFSKRGDYKKFVATDMTPETLLEDIQYMVKKVNNYYKLPILGKKDTGMHSELHSEANIITNVKFNRNSGEPTIRSAAYKVNSISTRINNLYNPWTCSYRCAYCAYVKAGTEISEELKLLLSFLNVQTVAPTGQEWNVASLYAAPKEYVEEYPKVKRSGARRPRILAEDKIVTISEISPRGGIFLNDKHVRVGDIDAKNSIFLTRPIYGDLFPLVAMITGKKVYRLRDRSKAVNNYLSKNGGSVININIGKNSRRELENIDSWNEIRSNSVNDEFIKLIKGNRLFQLGHLTSNGSSEMSAYMDHDLIADYLADNNKDLYNDMLYSALSLDKFYGKRLSEFMNIEPKYNWAEIGFTAIRGGYAVNNTRTLKHWDRAEQCEKLTKLFDVKAIAKHTYEYWVYEKLNEFMKDISYCSFTTDDDSCRYYWNDSVKGRFMDSCGAELLKETLWIKLLKEFEKSFENDKDAFNVIKNKMLGGKYTSLKYAPIIESLGRGKLDTEIKKAFTTDLNKIDADLKKVFKNIKIEVNVSDSVYDYRK